MNSESIKSSVARKNTTVPIPTSENDRPGFLEKLFIFLSFLFLIILFPLAIFFAFTTTREYERLVIFRCGRLRKGGARGPGLIFMLPFADRYVRVDLRTTSFDVPPQAILTKDSVTIKLDAVVYYRVEDPLKAVIQVYAPFTGVQLLARTTLRNVAGKRMLLELLASKDQLSNEIGQILDRATDPWGIMVERLEIKEIGMPAQLQRAMAAEQEAVRVAKAKIAAADGELNSARMLKEASDTMAKNPMTLQLRYLQTLSSIAAEHNHTVVIPIPVDVISKLLGNDNAAGSAADGSNGGDSDNKANGSNNEPTTSSANKTNFASEMQLQSSKTTRMIQTSFESIIDMHEYAYDKIPSLNDSNPKNLTSILLNVLSNAIASNKL